MSTRSSTPVGISLVLASGVAVVCAAIASSMLGYLQTTTVVTNQPWWVPVLTLFVPVSVLGAILLWVYSQT